MTIQELKTRYDKLEGFYEALKTRDAALDKELDMLQTESDLLAKSSAVLKHMLDVLVKDEISRMAGLITYGLKTVFDDQDLSFIPIMSKKNDRINIELRTKNGEVEGEYGSFGGSVAVVESFLLRVLCMLKMNLARFMLLDETFDAIGQEGSNYIIPTSKLISEIARKLGIDILLVTHQPDFATCADHSYKLKETSKGLEIDKVK